jgi:hypothetical protein
MGSSFRTCWNLLFITPLNPSNRKAFTIRKFSLGEDVNVDRNELYAERISIRAICN